MLPWLLLKDLLVTCMLGGGTASAAAESGANAALAAGRDSSPAVTSTIAEASCLSDASSFTLDPSAPASPTQRRCAVELEEGALMLFPALSSRECSESLDPASDRAVALSVPLRAVFLGTICFLTIVCVTVYLSPQTPTLPSAFCVFPVELCKGLDEYIYI